MSDRLKRFSVLAISGLALGSVIAAFALTGGPIQARKEYRDRIRLADMRAMHWHVQCMADAQGGPLPEDLAVMSGCGALPRMADPFTDQPYLYEVLNDRTIRICAGLELEGKDAQAMGGDDESAAVDEGTAEAVPGCRDYRINRPRNSGEAIAPADS